MQRIKSQYVYVSIYNKMKNVKIVIVFLYRALEVRK